MLKPHYYINIYQWMSHNIPLGCLNSIMMSCRQMSQRNVFVNATFLTLRRLTATVIRLLRLSPGLYNDECFFRQRQLQNAVLSPNYPIRWCGQVWTVGLHSYRVSSLARVPILGYTIITARYGRGKRIRQFTASDSKCNK